LNAVLARRLAAAPGEPDALLSDPVFEIARAWAPADVTLDDLGGNLLHHDLVAALDADTAHQMPRTMRPYRHQLAAWEACLREGRSALITAGTGSGKTEAFLIPILDDILRNPRVGGGVRAILLYPLNALIESQRERLSAWARGLGGRVRFALFNGDTPETERHAPVKSDAVELRSREAIREHPPEVLVTNITMLEYLLLRAQDRRILQTSEGGLRWMVLDEAHSYVGSQAAEMALLLRRVRAAFGVDPDDVRLLATSATIGGEEDAPSKLCAFAAALAGRPEDAVEVIEGEALEPELPTPGAERPLDAKGLAELDGETCWEHLADHPRVLVLRQSMSNGSVTLAEAAEILFEDPARRDDAQAVLDAVARATRNGERMAAWRAHLFHRAQGGVWACIDPECSYRDPELQKEGSAWSFGAVHLSPRARCDCGAPVYEVVGCSQCGAVHLQGRLVGGAKPRFEPPDPGDIDDFALDAEPDEEEAPEAETDLAWLSPGGDTWIDRDARIYDNAPPADTGALPFHLAEHAEARNCCDGSTTASLMGLRFGPAFFMSNALPEALELLTEPQGDPGRPAAGRRAITFSDSRQGVARLAAKLQQEAERTLTRAFLWHAVQEGQTADPAKVDKLRSEITKLRAAGLDDLDEIATDKERELSQLTGDAPKPIPWGELVRRFAQHHELNEFAGVVWRGRRLGENIADHPERLAEMFLYRELFRRPRVQNNPETMGLLRLSFPVLEERAQSSSIPTPLTQAGVDAAGWTGLALAAIDFVFRNNLAVDIPVWMVPAISPRFGVVNSVMPSDTKPSDRPSRRSRVWPSARPLSRPSRLQTLVYGLIGGDPDADADQDRASEVLEALWSLITGSGIAPDMGAGARRLDFSRAAVVRIDTGWLCPITRRPFGYHLGGRSPYDTRRAMTQVTFPRLPRANAGGLTAEAREEMARWCETDTRVAELRAVGLWTDLHDRIVAYPPFLRAQEHSAQIERPVLKRYEDEFRQGDINLLNCSTTMEMGVDIPQVRLVANANVPPALSNYRQRVGRAGRRGEPWAFALTFCRDLPLDRQTFDDPARFLTRQIVAPKVWFESAALVQRHVNAALLAAWLAEREGLDIRASMGSFLGAGETLAEPVHPNAPADLFLEDLRGTWGSHDARTALLEPIVQGTALEARACSALIAVAADAFDSVVSRWRDEHRVLLDRQEGAQDPATNEAFRLRAKRLRGEFLLGELARRGFTPAYGFPTDVIGFDHLSGRSDKADGANFSFRSRGAAARELHVAIREYAPGAEVVIDGLVHQSEGLLPAWSAGADQSGLEDLRDLWSCPRCHALGHATQSPNTCPQCGERLPEPRKILRPAGFLGRKPPHTGYERLAYVPLEPVRLSAQGGDWIALADPAAGRMRADPAGQVATTASGPLGGGYAVCLECGRAEPMEPPQPGFAPTLPEAMTPHDPLARGRSSRKTSDGRCAASDLPHRIQKNIHLAQVIHTAALGPAVGPSIGPAGEARTSAFLHDRAAGGAGLAARMAEPGMLSLCLDRVESLLDCPEACRRGCPSCILRPDTNLRDLRMDRPGALALAKNLSVALNIPAHFQVFGPDTRLVGRPLRDEIETRARSQRLDALDLYLQGPPEAWDLAAWPIADALPRLNGHGVGVTVYVAQTALGAAGLDLARKLGLHRIAAFATLRMLPEAPTAGDLPIIARFVHGDTTEAVAASEGEAVPDAPWGAGAVGPGVIGQAPNIPSGSALSADRLMQLGMGNARLLWPASSLDGPAKAFGRRFWSYLARQAPLEVEAIRQSGVAQLHYTDRYLLTPLALRLLVEVINAAPEASNAHVEIDTARADRPAITPKFVYDGFPHSSDKHAEVLREMLPRASVRTAARKTSLPHQRALTVGLRDGRDLLVLFDQGFGGWRAEGAVSFDFDLEVKKQARKLQGLSFAVRLRDLSPPIAVGWVQHH
jgi:ATP-dependent helicase YprA (DUF1998 family)